QRAVLRERGCNSPEVLCDFASVVPVRAVVSPRPRKAATTLHEYGGTKFSVTVNYSEIETIFVSDFFPLFFVCILNYKGKTCEAVRAGQFRSCARHELGI
ncbi:MAG: hypothetical protein LBU83_13235, partial [Bacteroidales bacterium]|nr:hypothetical protein [Bacteroidales bacterium]